MVCGAESYYLRLSTTSTRQNQAKMRYLPQSSISCPMNFSPEALVPLVAESHHQVLEESDRLREARHVVSWLLASACLSPLLEG